MDLTLKIQSSELYTEALLLDFVDLFQLGQIGISN